MSAPSSTLFASLGEAKKAGWIVRTRNAGPSDYVHYSAFIYHDGLGISEYLVSEDGDWERTDAKRHALEWINARMTRTPASGRQPIGEEVP